MEDDHLQSLDHFDVCLIVSTYTEMYQTFWDSGLDLDCVMSFYSGTRIEKAHFSDIFVRIQGERVSRQTPAHLYMYIQ